MSFTPNIPELPQERAPGETLFLFFCSWFCRYLQLNLQTQDDPHPQAQSHLPQSWESFTGTPMHWEFACQESRKRSGKHREKPQKPAEVQEVQSFRQNAMNRCKIPDEGMQKKILLLKREARQALEQFLLILILLIIPGSGIGGSTTIAPDEFLVDMAHVCSACP